MQEIPTWNLNLAMGHSVALHVRDAAAADGLHIDAAVLDLVRRMEGSRYRVRAEHLN